MLFAPFLLISLSFLRLFTLIPIALPSAFDLPFCSLPFLLGQERAKRRRHQLCNPIWSRAQPLLLISTFKTVRERPGVLPHRALDWNFRGLVLVQVLLMTSMFTWDKRCNPSGPSLPCCRIWGKRAQGLWGGGGGRGGRYHCYHHPFPPQGAFGNAIFTMAEWEE